MVMRVQVDDYSAVAAFITGVDLTRLTDRELVLLGNLCMEKKVKAKNELRKRKNAY